MKILITGGSGFIGKSVINFLKNNDEKYILALTRKKIFFDKDIKFIQGNIGNLAKIQTKIIRFNPEIVIHLAWEGIPDLNYTNSYKNLKNSIKFFDLIFRKTSCKKIIISGSCLEYGKQYGLCNETSQTKINTYFNWAKTSLYHYLLIHSKIKKIDIIWFRIFYAFGINQRKKSLIPYLIDSIKKNKIPIIDNFHNQNDFIYVEDIAEAFYKAIKLKNFNGIINLGSGSKTSVLQICKMVEEKLNGYNKLFKNIPKKQSSKNNSGLIADINLAKKILKWEPRHDLKKAISKII